MPLPWQPDVLLVSVPPETEMENNGLKNKRLIIFSLCHKWILFTIARLKSHRFVTTAILKIHNRKKDLIWTVWTHFAFDIFRNLQFNGWSSHEQNFVPGTFFCIVFIRDLWKFWPNYIQTENDGIISSKFYNKSWGKIDKTENVIFLSASQYDPNTMRNYTGKNCQLQTAVLVLF